MNEQNRVGLAHLPAAVDHLLRAPLDLGVAALHRVEVEVGGVGAGGQGRCRTAAQADAQRWPAELDQQRARREAMLQHVRFGHVADAAGDHDRLVVTPHTAIHGLFKRAEIARQIRPAEFVVERRRADWPVEHDLQRRDDAVRLADRVGLPRQIHARHPQVRGAEAAQPGLGLGAESGRALVADLAASASRRAGKRRDGGRVVVRLHLHQGVHRLIRVAVFAAADAVARVPARHSGAGHHRRVVGVRAQGVLRIGAVRLADHREQALRLRLPVHHKLGVKDFVPAVLGVGLREHHQLGVGGVAAEGGVGVGQVVDLVVGQCQAKLDIGARQRGAGVSAQRHGHQRCRCVVAKHPLEFGFERHRFGHAVVQGSGNGVALDQHQRPVQLDGVDHAALDPPHRVQSAVVGDVGGLRRPRADGADARRHQKRRSARQVSCRHRRVIEQAVQAGEFVVAQRSRGVDEVAMLGVQPADVGQQAAQGVKQLGQTEIGEGAAAAQGEDGHGGRERGGRGVGAAGRQTVMIRPRALPAAALTLRRSRRSAGSRC